MPFPAAIRSIGSSARAHPPDPSPLRQNGHGHRKNGPCPHCQDRKACVYVCTCLLKDVYVRPRVKSASPSVMLFAQNYKRSIWQLAQHCTHQAQAQRRIQEKKKFRGLSYAVYLICSHLQSFNLLFIVKKSKKVLLRYPWIM